MITYTKGDPIIMNLKFMKKQDFSRQDEKKLSELKYSNLIFSFI